MQCSIWLQNNNFMAVSIMENYKRFGKLVKLTIYIYIIYI